MPKRVLYISPGLDLGGGEISLLSLIANLDPERYTPVVCAYGPGRFVERASNLNCELYILSYDNVFSQFAFVMRLSKLIKQCNTDIVHVNTLDIRAGVAARHAKRPLVGHLRVIFPTTWVDRTFVKLANTTISVSDAVRDHFCEAEGTSPDQFQTIYNAIDVQPGEETDLKHQLGLSPETPLLGVIGRIDPWKGMETFVEAAAQLKTTHPDAHCLIAGSPGPSENEQCYDRHLKQRVEQLGISRQFHFLGYRSDALNVINQLDALIVPSRILQTPEGIKTEGFGRVAAEGLAMRTPVIASKVGGLPEIIEHGESGFLFIESDADDLTEKLRTLLDTPDLSSQLTEAGYKRFTENFSVSCHLNQIQALYDGLIKQ